MKFFKKQGLGLKVAPTIAKITVFVIIFLVSLVSLSTNQSVNAQAIINNDEITYDGTTYTLDGGTHIQSSSGNDHVYLPSRFSCGSQIMLRYNDNMSVELRSTSRSSSPNSGGSGQLDSCNVAANGTSLTLTAAAGSDSDSDSNSDDSELAADTCESRTPGWGWLLCGGIDLVDGGINWVDNQIQRLLEVNEDRYTNENLKDVWTTFRNIAYIILIPIMLVMVIGTAIGVEAFSAYTVRKALPRMVAAIIFITLSWYICTFLIGFFNTMGAGVNGLITAPFRENIAATNDPACADGSLNLTCLFSTDTEVAGGAGVLRGIVTAVAQVGVVVGLVVFLLFIAGSLLVAIIGAFLVIFAREMFILALLLLSPLAILAWIFPGNDKLWKWWWSIFSKLLLMYPIIMGIIAIGRIFAWIINESGGAGLEGSVLKPIMKLVAYLLPYAFIPFVFKMAGGVFANLAGIVDNKEKGLADRWKKLRGAGIKKGHESVTSGKGRYTGVGKKGALGRVGNIYRRGANFGRHGSFSRSAAGKDRWGAYQQKLRDSQVGEATEKDAGWALNNDDMTKAVVQAGIEGGGKKDAVRHYAEAKIRKDLDKEAKKLGLKDASSLTAEQVNAIRAEVQADRYREAIGAAEQFEQSTGLTIGTDVATVTSQRFRTAGTNTAYGAGAEGAEELQKDLQALQAKGLISAQDAATWVKSNRGRTDWSAAGFGDATDFATGKISAEDYIKRAYAGADPRELFGGHTNATSSFAEVAATESKTAQQELINAIDSGQPPEVVADLQVKADKAAANLEGAFQQMRYASPKKADMFADDVLSVPITYRVKVVEEYAVRDASGNPVFRGGKPLTEKRYVWKNKSGTHRQMLEDTKERVLSDGTNGDLPDSRMADRGQGSWRSRTESEAVDEHYREELERRAREEEE